MRYQSYGNERILCARTCDSCKKNIVARFHKDVPFPVYCNSCWHSDAWDALEHGRDYDFSKNFFEQLVAIRNKTPALALNVINMENADYCNQCAWSKNVYLSVSVINAEDVAYSYRIDESRNIFNG